jgi:radical S-adenosyl methionine domain-containing protein 2
MSTTHTFPAATVVVNFHLIKACNLKCRFCFATFRAVHGNLALSDCRELLRRLRAAGCEKLTFVGGEPTLHPHIAELIAYAHELGLVVGLVTNGALLGPLLATHAAYIDWVGLSVDSPNPSTQMTLGRGKEGYIEEMTAHADSVHALGIRLKLNSVVTRLNYTEDMSMLVRRLRPNRWKVFQVLPIQGQNDGSVEPLTISADQFRQFVANHQHLEAEGLAPIAEDNDAMTSSYAMIDPLGRFFNNGEGRHQYSDPILKVGVTEALDQVGFQVERLIRRGGIYRWK